MMHPTMLNRTYYKFITVFVLILMCLDCGKKEKVEIIKPKPATSKKKVPDLLKKLDYTNKDIILAAYPDAMNKDERWFIWEDGSECKISGVNCLDGNMDNDPEPEIVVEMVVDLLSSFFIIDKTSMGLKPLFKIDKKYNCDSTDFRIINVSSEDNLSELLIEYQYIDPDRNQLVYSTEIYRYISNEFKKIWDYTLRSDLGVKDILKPQVLLIDLAEVQGMYGFWEMVVRFPEKDEIYKWNGESYVFEKIVKRE
ncbi:MAG: hypothetical protein AB1765_10195 [Candidatus Hydrogenedentota bacterium]